MVAAIYEPRGKAGEYNKLALNLYAGCSHGCKYCYAPKATFKPEAEFFGSPKPRPEIIKALELEMGRKYRFPEDRPSDPVLLCFTSDPYQPLDVREQLTRRAIQLIKDGGMKVSILSKGGKRSERDLDLLGAGDQFGATLTFVSDKDSLEWEPGAALPEARFDALRKAHACGVKTWASMEPVIDPEQTLEIIRQTHKFVDKFKVGKLNYHAVAKTIDWADFGARAVSLLDSLGADYYIKDDLKKYL